MRRVLFVDDDPVFLAGLQRLLRTQRSGWEVAFAPGGAAALTLLGASAFDVIVSDLRMPEMGGADLLARVQAEYPQVVRIILSDPTEVPSALRVVPVAHQFLVKPCDGEMLRVAVERACHLKALLQDDSIRGMVGSLSELPSLPRTYHALAMALGDPETSLRKVADIVEQDVGISAKVLQLVNSAFFGAARSITSIPHAVTYLGISTLKTLVLSVEIFNVFVPGEPIEGFCLEDLQGHARLTSHLASRLPVPHHLVDIAMAAGMLHDVGKLIQAWKVPKRFRKLLSDAQQEKCPLHVIEEREYGFTHAEIGAYLLGLWGLPYAVVEAVALHHAPDRVPHQTFDAASAVYIANLLTRRAGFPGSPPDENPLQGSEDYLASLGVEEDVPHWLAMAAEAPQLIGVPKKPSLA